MHYIFTNKSINILNPVPAQQSFVCIFRFTGLLALHGAMPGQDHGYQQTRR